MTVLQISGICYTTFEGILGKIIDRFIIRNFGDQKAMGQYIQSTKRKGQ